MYPLKNLSNYISELQKPDLTFVQMRRMTLSVHRPATAAPDDSSGLSVAEFFTEKLKISNVVLAPPTFEFSEDPKKVLGEEAEKKVIDSIQKCGYYIPGTQIICFHGVRVIGKCNSNSKSVIREVDQCCFITYQGRRYILITEVKCNADIRKSSGTRKKAIAQLNTFTEMLKNELNIPMDKLQVHSVWPNMEPTEPCRCCQGRHPSLYEKPMACQQPGTQQRADPEPDGFHVFKDKFDGDEFSIWIKSIVDDPSKAVDEGFYQSILQFVTRHCVGVLYDETVKSFCILGKDQAKLVKKNEQPLNEPTVIYGLGGTGKTISIMARIQHISGHLNAASRAIYLTSKDNAIEMVKKKLEACNVDLTHITFANFATYPFNRPGITPDEKIVQNLIRDRYRSTHPYYLSEITRDEKVVQNLIRHRYRFVYMDSVEDFGVDWVNELFARTVTTDMQKRTIAKKGDFWITVDPYQGLRDSHSLMMGTKNQIHWLGNLANDHLLEEGFKTDRIVKLEECFRMPVAMIKHIESEKVLPTTNLPKAQDVKSLGVMEKNIKFPLGYSIQSMAEHLAEQLYTNVMKRGIHPGHCAVVFHGGAEVELFPPQDGGLPAFVQLVNDTLRAIPVKSHAGHMIQLSPNIEETLLYNRYQRSTSSPSVSIPMVSEISSNVDVEDTAEYQAERHAEVI